MAGFHYKVGDVGRYFTPNNWSQEKLHWYAYFHINGQYVHKNELINGPMRPSELVELFQNPQLENYLMVGQLWYYPGAERMGTTLESTCHESRILGRKQSLLGRNRP